VLVHHAMNTCGGGEVEVQLDEFASNEGVHYCIVNTSFYVFAIIRSADKALH